MIERPVSPTLPARAPATRSAPPAHPFHLASAQAATADTASVQTGSAQTDLAEAAQLSPTRTEPTQWNGTAEGGPCRVGPSQVGPSRIVIVWTDGTITTVHAPEILAGPPEPTTFPDLER